MNVVKVVNVVPLGQRIPAPDGWPSLAEDALHGVAGDIVRLIAPHSETDPVAILIHILVYFGNIVGRGPYFQVEADRHGLNLFANFVGASSKGRKGAAQGHVSHLFKAIDADWITQNVQAGLSSGEGLVWAVRNPISQTSPVKLRGQYTGEYETIVVDQGVDDKRLLVIEGEFASTLKVMKREGNVLSTVIRKAWDSGDLQILTKNSPAASTGAHISIIGHITKDELLRYLDTCEAGNGFGNRFLWACVRRTQLLPEGGSLNTDALSVHTSQIEQAMKFAQEMGPLQRDSEAREIWHSVYPSLSEAKPGLLGAMIARAEAQVMRLAAIYAVLDCSSLITKQHLMAGLAVWEYCENSARYIFGDRLGDPTAESILRELRDRPNGLTRTEIRDLFKHNKNKVELDRALALLRDGGFARSIDEPGQGTRPVERWFAS